MSPKPWQIKGSCEPTREYEMVMQYGGFFFFFFWKWNVTTFDGRKKKKHNFHFEKEIPHWVWIELPRSGSLLWWLLEYCPII